MVHCCKNQTLVAHDLFPVLLEHSGVTVSELSEMGGGNGVVEEGF